MRKLVVVILPTVALVCICAALFGWIAATPGDAYALENDPKKQEHENMIPKDWFSGDHFEQYFDIMFAKGYYPKEVHAKEINGVVYYKGMFEPIPDKGSFYMYFEMTPEGFRERNHYFTQQGFELIWKNELTTSSGDVTVQATWLK